MELRHQVEIHVVTGRIVECPFDEMNKPRSRKQAALRIPPTDAEIRTLFAGWRQELVSCRKFAPTARNYLAAKLMSQVGLRVNEACNLDLADVKWELGPVRQAARLTATFGGTPLKRQRDAVLKTVNPPRASSAAQS